MSQLPALTRSESLAVATAATLGLFVTLSAPAQAHPLLPPPLGPACSQWGFPGEFSLKQSNGDTVRFTSTGPVASGLATATGGGNGPLTGDINGGVTGDKLDFSINWGVIFHQPSVGHYLGVVGVDGFAHGSTADVFSSEPAANWDSTVPLVCNTPAPSTPTPAAEPPQNPALSQPATKVPNRRVIPPLASGGLTATVSSDVDIYDAPGGNGNKIGVLRSGRQVKLVAACKPDDWCNVVIPELPSGSGWVWDQFLQF